MRHKERNRRYRPQRSKRLRVAKWPTVRYVMVFHPNTDQGSGSAPTMWYGERT